jgi:hypothetical protein
MDPSDAVWIRTRVILAQFDGIFVDAVMQFDMWICTHWRLRRPPGGHVVSEEPGVDAALHRIGRLAMQIYISQRAASAGTLGGGHVQRARVVIRPRTGMAPESTLCF